MKRLFSTGYNSFLFDLILLIIRISVACLMIKHGIPKLGKFFADGEIKFADPIGVGTLLSLILTVFAEVICSVFIFFGLATRLATVPLIATMGVAAFLVHADDLFGKGEMAILYFLIYLFLLVTGGGKYALDRFLSR